MTSHPGDSTMIYISPESTSSQASWPDLFCVLRFTYEAEIKLQKAHVAFKENGMLLIPDPKAEVRHIMGVDPGDSQVHSLAHKFDEVAEALI
ncbi:hypothetical protein FQN60_015827, partial [Etheostoma spectabile]